MKEVHGIFMHDAGHGWLNLTRHDAAKSGKLDEVSEYSYQKGPFVYLEEDLDLGIVKEALEAKGYKLMIEDRYMGDEAVIRNYERFKGRTR